MELLRPTKMIQKYKFTGILLPVIVPLESMSMSAKRNFPCDLNKYFLTIVSTYSDSFIPLKIMN